MAIDVDHGRVGRNLARDELVRLEDRQHLLDARVALERQQRELLPVADRADHGRLAPTLDAGLDAVLRKADEHVLDLVGRRGCAHHDEQLRGSGRGRHFTQCSYGYDPCRCLSSPAPARHGATGAARACARKRERRVRSSDPLDFHEVRRA